MRALLTAAPSAPKLHGNHLALDSCRLGYARRDALRFSGQTRSQSPLVAAPAAGALAALPWLTESAASGLQQAVSLGLSLLGVGLLRMGLPKRIRVTVCPDSNSLQCGKATYPLGAHARYCLRLSPPDLAPQCLYWIALDTGGDDLWPLLVGPRPDLLLHDLNRCLEHLDLPVIGTWGMPKDAQPWKFQREVRSQSSKAHSTTARRVAQAPRRQSGGSPPHGCSESSEHDPERRVRANRTDPALPRVMLSVLLVVAFTLTIHAGSGLQQARHSPHVLSLVLPTLWVGYLAFVVFAASAKSQVRVQGALLSVRGGILGRASRKVPQSHVRCVHLVGEHASAEVCHLLVETDSGPLAARVRQSEASAFAETVTQTLLGVPQARPRSVANAQ